MKTYTQDFYNRRDEKTRYSANVILSILLEHIHPIRSAIDIGCGVGTWLSVLKEKGVEHIQGIDGNWVEQNFLVIPKDSFQQFDLNKRLKLPKRYDLAISLEVAEHLPCEQAQEFVLSLTELSDFVLFSSAIPFQEGRNHINTQWQHYWVELFAANGYEVNDFIRTRIWNDKKIPYWYRQNIFLFSAQKRTTDLSFDANNPPLNQLPLDIVHPHLYLSKARKTDSIKSIIRTLFRSLKRSIRSKLGISKK